jgi:serine protease
VTFAATLVVAPWITFHAQEPVLNGKQRLLAGEPVSENAAAAVSALKLARTTAPKAIYAPGRIVVKLAEGQAESRASELAVHVGARNLSRPAYADFSIITIDPDRDVVAAARELAAQPGVLYAEPDAVAHTFDVPNDPLYKYQWNFAKIGMPRAWDINHGADQSIIVAVIDSGLAYLDKGDFKQAPDLVGTNYVAPHDFIWDDDEPVDLDGHGTHVTGTIGERADNNLGVAGMAFNVSVMPIKAISTDWDDVLGSPNTGTSSVVAQAIRYAADHGAKVINMSFGFDVEVSVVRDAIIYAVDKGAVLVAAAGNSGDEGSPPAWPAAYGPSIEGLIAVAALDANLNRAFYSNSNDYVEISAPGGDTSVDTDNDGYPDGVLQQTLDLDLVESGVFDQFGYFFLEGTSMAAPHVSGLAALLISQGITKPPAVEAAIVRFATDRGASGKDNDTGAGAINPRATLRGLGLSR